jgi:hypothetical protein
MGTQKRREIQVGHRRWDLCTLVKALLIWHMAVAQLPPLQPLGRRRSKAPKDPEVIIFIKNA